MLLQRIRQFKAPISDDDLLQSVVNDEEIVKATAKEIIETADDDNCDYWVDKVIKLSLLRFIRDTDELAYYYDVYVQDDEILQCFWDTKIEDLRTVCSEGLVKLKEACKSTRESDLNFYSFDELPRSDRENKWLIDRVIKESSFNELIAPSKAGKSQLAYQLAYEVSNGLDFLGLFHTEKSKVLYIDFEMSAPEIIERKNNLIEFEAAGNADNIRVMRPGPMQSGDFDLVLDKCRQMKNNDSEYKLVIFDNFYSLCGAINTNDMAETNLILDKMKYGLAEDGLAVILVNHTNKATALESQKYSDEDINDSTILNSAFGSMAHGAKVDTAILVQKLSDGRRIHITGRKVDKPIRVSCLYGESTKYFYQRVAGEDGNAERLLKLDDDIISALNDYLGSDGKAFTNVKAWFDKAYPNADVKLSGKRLKVSGFNYYKVGTNYYVNRANSRNGFNRS